MAYRSETSANAAEPELQAMLAAILLGLAMELFFEVSGHSLSRHGQTLAAARRMRSEKPD
jgi:hypothetical protein